MLFISCTGKSKFILRPWMHIRSITKVWPRCNPVSTNNINSFNSVKQTMAWAYFLAASVAFIMVSKKSLKVLNLTCWNPVEEYSTAVKTLFRDWINKHGSTSMAAIKLWLFCPTANVFLASFEKCWNALDMCRNTLLVYTFQHQSISHMNSRQSCRIHLYHCAI